MLKTGACAVLLAVLAVSGAPQALADHRPFHRPLLDDCRWATSFHCFGPERDFRVDWLYRVSCSEARDILEDRGFQKIRTVACGGRYHSFKARWKGKVYRLAVSRSSGNIVSMKRVK
jgi:hypothetical protein